MAVVAPAAGGPLDLVEPGRTGLLVTPGSGRAIAVAVAELAADAATRAAVRASGRAAVEGRSWASVVGELVGHYEAVLDGTRTPARRAASPVAA